MTQTDTLRADFPAPHVQAQTYAMKVEYLRVASLESAYPPFDATDTPHPYMTAHNLTPTRQSVRLANGVWGVAKKPLWYETASETLSSRLAAAGGFAVAPTFVTPASDPNDHHAGNISIIPFFHLAVGHHFELPRLPSYLTHYAETLPLLFLLGPSTDRHLTNVCLDMDRHGRYCEYDFAESNIASLALRDGDAASNTNLSSCFRSLHHMAGFDTLSFAAYERGLRKLDAITPATIDSLCQMVGATPELSLEPDDPARLSAYLCARREAVLSTDFCKAVKNKMGRRTLPHWLSDGDTLAALRRRDKKQSFTFA